MFNNMYPYLGYSTNFTTNPSTSASSTTKGAQPGKQQSPSSSSSSSTQQQLQQLQQPPQGHLNSPPSTRQQPFIANTTNPASYFNRNVSGTSSSTNSSTNSRGVPSLSHNSMQISSRSNYGIQSMSGLGTHPSQYQISQQQQQQQLQHLPSWSQKQNLLCLCQ